MIGVLHFLLPILFSATWCYSDDGVAFGSGNSHGDDGDNYVADEEEDHLELNTIAK